MSRTTDDAGVDAGDSPEPRPGAPGDAQTGAPPGLFAAADRLGRALAGGPASRAALAKAPRSPRAGLTDPVHPLIAVCLLPRVRDPPHRPGSVLMGHRTFNFTLCHP